MSKLNGLVQIVLSLIWLWHYGSLLYQYNYTNLQFIFVYPNWALVVFLVLGILGVLIGLSVLLEKKSVKAGYFQFFVLFTIGLVTDIIVVA